MLKGLLPNQSETLESFWEVFKISSGILMTRDTSFKSWEKLKLVGQAKVITIKIY